MSETLNYEVSADGEETTLPLKRTVIFGPVKQQKTYTTLTLRPPLAGEFEKASAAQTEVGVLISLIGLVAGVPRGMVEEMAQSDLHAAGDILQPYSQSESDESDEAHDNDVDEKVFVLRKPVMLGSGQNAQEYKELTLCEPTAKQTEKSSSLPRPISQLITKIALVARVPRLVIERSDLRDVMEMGLFLNRFKPANQKTGGTLLVS